MNPLLNLSDAPIGMRVYVQQLESTPEVCSRLREMGFCENAEIRCISRNGVCLICEVCNTRIGLNNAIAENIVVSRYANRIAS